MHPGLFCSRQAINDILKKAFDGMSELPVEIIPFETDPTEDEGYVAYVIYIHQGQKHIQAIEDPYPKGFPADQAVEHMEAALEYLEQQEDDYGNAHPALEWCGFREVIRARMDAAMLDLHDVSREDLLSVIETGKRLRLPHGARIAMIDAATCWEPSVVELILKGTQHANPKLATKQQASQIVRPGRLQAGRTRRDARVPSQRNRRHQTDGAGPHAGASREGGAGSRTAQRIHRVHAVRAGTVGEIPPTRPPLDKVREPFLKFGKPW